MTASGSVEVPPTTHVASVRSNDHAAIVVDCARAGDRSAGAARIRSLTEDCITRTGRGIDLTQADLSGLDLSGFDLRGATLNRASLFGTRLAGANVGRASMVCAGIERSDFTDADLRGAYVHSLAAQASTFTRAKLDQLVDATGALFHGCDLTGASLRGAELAGTTFYQCNLTGADLVGADLHGAMFNESALDNADLSSAVVADATIVRSSMTETNLSSTRGEGMSIRRPPSADGLRFTGANLPTLRLADVRGDRVCADGLHAAGLDVDGGDLHGVNFSGADLSRSRWSRCTLNGATLVDTVLTDSTWLGVTAREANFGQARGEGFTASECTFSNSRFAGFAGRYATFRSCDLRAADMRGAYLYRATIVGDPPTSACLMEATLDGANLTQAYLAADFRRASIRNAWAVYARVNQSRFDGADLRGTSLFRASAVKTDFTDAKLGGQRGLLLADRAAGLLDALRASDDPDAKTVAESLDRLYVLLADDRGKST